MVTKINSIDNKTETLTIDNVGEGVLQTSSTGVVSGSKGTDGQLLISSSSGAPDWAAITSTGGSITVTPGSNSINLETAAGSGGGTKITKFTSSDTWTKDGDAQMIEYHVWQGGSGGGSGGMNTHPGGGGGGSAGCYFYTSAPAFMYPASGSVVIGAGAAGGIAVVSDGPGNAGSNSTATTFLAFDGSNQVASGGPAGSNATVGPATPGAWYHPFSALESDDYKYVPAAGTGKTGIGGNATNLGGINFKGGYCCAGSGGGGGGSNGAAGFAGGTGSGIYASEASAYLAAPTAGGAAHTDGADGADNTATGAGVLHGGLGGGGGGGSESSLTGIGDGGAGGIPGGGGGGGGGLDDSMFAISSGAGGAGGRGEVIVIEYLG